MQTIEFHLPITVNPLIGFKEIPTNKNSFLSLPLVSNQLLNLNSFLTWNYFYFLILSVL